MQLTIGTTGTEVRQVQHSLNLAAQTRLPPLAVDGIFGPKTKSRVVEFQGDNGLKPDGIVGQLTVQAVQEALRLLNLVFPPPLPVVRPITKQILGMDGPNNLIEQILPAISVISPASFIPGRPAAKLSFSVASLNVGRLGIFAANKNGVERAVILLLPRTGVPDRTIICITQGFGQARKTLDPLGWNNPLSKPFIEFVLLKHVVNRWGAQTLASKKQMAFVYIVRAKGSPELGPFARDGAFMKQVLTEMAALTGNAFSFGKAEAFTFSSGILDFNPFIDSLNGHVNIEAVYSIDPAGSRQVSKPPNAIRKQFASGQAGGPGPGFEFLPLDRWSNEPLFPTRTTFPQPFAFNYLHNHCMPLYILNLALQTS